MKFAALAFMLLAVGYVSGQGKPEKGKFEELKGMHRVYVGGPDRDVVAGLINGKDGLEVVGDPSNAEFYLTFKVLRRDESIYATMIIGEMTAHILNGDKVRQVWSREGSGGSTGGAAASGLAKKFLKEFQKLSGVE